MLAHTLQAVRRCPEVGRIIVVVPPDRLPDGEELTRRERGSLPTTVVAGGGDRQASVAAGLARLGEPAVVLVHDGARPLVRAEVIAAVIRAAAATGAAAAGLPVRETVKAVRDGRVTATVDREGLWLAHTPQAFHPRLLREAHRRAEAEGFRGPDDAVLVERMGHPVHMVEDSPTNVKITVPDDLLLAECYLGGPGVTVRTGIGMDVHRLSPGRPLRLGGIEIAHPQGLAGHSDADVLLHAVMDALLGAAGLGDIGTHFPPGEEAYKDADSTLLLARVGGMLAEAGWAVVHLDAVVVAEAPVLAPYMPRMRYKIGEVLGIDPDLVSIKATTTEGLGAVGRGEGIAAHAVATLSRRR